MCGKFKQKPDLSALVALLRLPVDSGSWDGADADITAGKTTYVVTGSADRAILQPMRFGFASAAGLGVRPVINARGETMSSKPLFRAAFTNRRCLIPAHLFYEQGRIITPHNASALFCLAGLWQTGADGMDECVVITRTALPPLLTFHDRMPLVLTDTAMCRDWLLRAQTPPIPPELTVQEKTPPAESRQMALF